MNSKVYGICISPFVRKVLIVLDIKNIPYESVDIRPGKQPAEYKIIIPLNKIPAFEDDLVCISDSAVICDYLEHRYPEPKLYPDDFVQRAKVLWLEKYAETALSPLVGPGLFFEKKVRPVRFGEPANETRIKDSLSKLPTCLAYLEKQLGENNQAFLVNDTLSIADISVCSQILHATYADFSIDAKQYPTLHAYFKKVISLSAFEKCIAADRIILENLA